jgi:hypothetical protein
MVHLSSFVHRKELALDKPILFGIIRGTKLNPLSAMTKKSSTVKIDRKAWA